METVNDATVDAANSAEPTVEQQPTDQQLLIEAFAGAVRRRAESIEADAARQIETIKANAARELAIAQRAGALARESVESGKLDITDVDDNGDGVIEDTEADNALYELDDKARDLTRLDEVDSALREANAEFERLIGVTQAEEETLARLQAENPTLYLVGRTTDAQRALWAVESRIGDLNYERTELRDGLGLSGDSQS